MAFELHGYLLYQQLLVENKQPYCLKCIFFGNRVHIFIVILLQLGYWRRKEGRKRRRILVCFRF